MEIIDIKTERDGSFSSSSIWKLTTQNAKKDGFGKPGLTYISEKRMEIKLGRPLDSEIYSKPTSWGNLNEKRVFDLLPMNYQLESRTRFAHPTIPNWTGAPDILTPEIVADIKCPFTLKAFCELVDSFSSLENFKEHTPEYYWQLVSNSILTGRNIAQSIIYVPYKDELIEIHKSATESDDEQFKWVQWAKSDQLPYLIEGKFYKNLNIFEFVVPESDKLLLTQKVQEAVILLNI